AVVAEVLPWHGGRGSGQVVPDVRPLLGTEGLQVGADGPQWAGAAWPAIVDSDHVVQGGLLRRRQVARREDVDRGSAIGQSLHVGDGQALCLRLALAFALLSLLVHLYIRTHPHPSPLTT